MFRPWPAAIAFAILICPGAASAETGYVYLGVQPGRQAAMEFVAPNSLQKEGAQTTASILRVFGTGFEKIDPAYAIDSDAYDCARKTITVRASESYAIYDDLLSKTGPKPPVPIAQADGLARLGFDSVCGKLPKTATITLMQAVLNSRVVMSFNHVNAVPQQDSAAEYLPGNVASPYGITVPAKGFFQIPGTGNTGRIWDVYRAPDGHLVVSYFYRADQTKTGGRDDYYDMLTGRALVPDQEQAMAYSHDQLAERLRPQNLRKLDSNMFNILAPEGSDASEHYDGGSLCGKAYANSVSADGADGEFEIAFFRKLSKPEKFKSPCGVEVLLHYTNVGMSPLAPDKQGFLASADQPSMLVWFDWRMHSKYFSGQQDVIAVPWDEFQKALQKDPDDGDDPSPKGLKKAEALIAHYGDLQMKGHSPLSMVGP